MSTRKEALAELEKMTHVAVVFEKRGEVHLILADAETDGVSLPQSAGINIALVTLSDVCVGRTLEDLDALLGL